jgi:integrase
MGTIYQKSVTLALPASATITTKERRATPKELRADSSRLTIEESRATWTDRKGEKRSGVVVDGLKKTLRVRVKTETYYAKFRDGSGNIREVPTGCRDKQAAKSKLAELESQAEKIRAGVITSQDAETGKHAKRPVVDHIADYCDYLTQEDKHPDRVKTTKKRLLEVADACDFRRLHDMNADKFLKWLSVELQKDRSLATLNEYIGTMISFGYWLTGKRVRNKKASMLGDKRLELNPFAGVGKYNEADDLRRQRRALNEDELRRLLFAARWRPIAEYGRETVARTDDDLPTSPRSRKPWSLARLDFETIQGAVDIAKAKLGANTAFLEQLDQRGFERYLVYKVAVLTGLRRGEIESLTIDHLRLDGPTAFLSMKPGDTKNREAVDVPLRADLVDELKQWVELKTRSRSTLKIKSASIDRNQRLFNVPKSLVRCLDRDLAAAGIAKVDDRGRTVDIHALRHTFGTLLSKGGVAPRTAQQAMRHSDIRLTMKTYTDPRLLDVAGAVDALPDLSIEPTWNQQLAKATGTDNTPATFAPTFAPDRSKTGQNGANMSNILSATASDDETKKPLDSQGKQGLFDNRGDKIRTCGLYVPNETAQRGRCSKSQGKTSRCRTLAPMLAPDRRMDRKLRH